MGWQKCSGIRRSYLEGNDTAVLFDGNHSYQNINFKNCFFSLNRIHVSGDTVLSGSIDKTNVFYNSEDKPGYIRMNGSSNGRQGLKIKLQDQWSTTNIYDPTINTATTNQVGNNIVLERDITIANPSTNSPVARSTERYGIVSRDCIGSSVGNIPSGMVPFCSVVLNGLNVTINTRIGARNHEMFAFSFIADTAAGQVIVSGICINGVVQQPSGQRVVTVSINSNGGYSLNFSSTTSAITSCTGHVRII